MISPRYACLLRANRQSLHLAILALTASIPLTFAPLACLSQTVAPKEQFSAQTLAAPMLRDPISVYNNWSSYDELSDNVPLTEDTGHARARPGDSACARSASASITT